MLNFGKVQNRMAVFAWQRAETGGGGDDSLSTAVPSFLIESRPGEMEAQAQFSPQEISAPCC